MASSADGGESPVSAADAPGADQAAIEAEAEADATAAQGRIDEQAARLRLLSRELLDELEPPDCGEGPGGCVALQLPGTPNLGSPRPQPGGWGDSPTGSP